MTMTKETFTVRELIEALSKVNPELVVWLEGCDCEGKWNGELNESGGGITLERDV